MRRWNGWGDDTVEFALNAAALGFLRERVGSGTPITDASFEQACQGIPVSRLAEEKRQQIVDERALAAAGGTMDEQRSLEATPGRGPLHDRPRGRLPEAEKARH